jgi:ATP-dependent Lon protease
MAAEIMPFENDENSGSNAPETLLLIPLDDTVVFPTMSVTLPVKVGDDEKVLLVPRRDGEYAGVGTIATVSERLRLPGGAAGVQLDAEMRGIAGAAHTDPMGQLRVETTPSPDDSPVDGRTRELVREYRAIVEEILEIRGDDGRIASWVRAIVEPGALADTSGFAPDLTFEQKVKVLEALDVTERLELVIEMQRERLAELQVRRKIREDVEEGAAKQQREYVLRQQMESIRRELGEDEGSVVDDLRRQVEEAPLPENVREQAERELDRLERMGEGNGEAQMLRSYLEWIVSMPWGEHSEDDLDPVHTREVLDADHAGLEDVKDRIVEYVAVRRLREQRAAEKPEAESGATATNEVATGEGEPETGGTAEKRSDDRDGAILTLIGPPGTGKTSIGESIARSMGREFVRMSLGGVRDEAEIRGHRRTYIGALPGRLVRALRDAGTMNPVILLDEVDKVGSDWRGDPSSALLEVLDPAQNSTFRDHYLDVEIDLSDVIFIATANSAETIPGPLLDRMEVIGFDGYTVAEKVAIARDYLWPRQLKRNGLREDEVTVSDELLRTIVDEYTREAGVRQLERELGKLLRKTATKVASRPEGSDEETIAIDLDAIRDALGRQKVFPEAAARTAVPGVATGLAVTGTGGDVLFVEANSMPGKGNGGLTLTGQLGDVMKESARIALTYVRAHADELGIDQSAFEDTEFHVHVPAGAIPKDGPSAGIAMTTALASLLSGRPVKHTVGMTGEVTLQGRVLPIGGLKQKVLAAHAAGLTDVILPERNRGDLDDVPEDVREEMNFHPVMTIDEVLELALEPAVTASARA